MCEVARGKGSPRRGPEYPSGRKTNCGKSLANGRKKPEVSGSGQLAIVETFVILRNTGNRVDVELGKFFIALSQPLLSIGARRLDAIRDTFVASRMPLESTKEEPPSSGRRGIRSAQSRSRGKLQ